MESNRYQTAFNDLRDKSRILANSSTSERIRKVRLIIEYLRINRVEMHKVMQADLQRHPVDIDAEWLMVKGEAAHICKNLKKWVRFHRVKNSALTTGTRSGYRYEAKGTVLILTPWNAPLAIPLVPLMGAIAAGNSVMLKPSELSPHVSDFLVKMIGELFEPDEVSVMTGDGGVAADLLKLPFDHIFYTGGAAIGKIVMKAAADHLSSVTLELGGKNPVIIDESADLKNCAEKIAWGKCANAGQACVAPDTVYVHESVKDKWVELMRQSFQNMYNSDGKGIQESGYYSRIINRRHFDRISSLLDDAQRKGARIEFGGERDADDLYIEPTLISSLAPDMDIVTNEIFGPLLSVVSWQEPDEVVEMIRMQDKPLSLYIFSKNRKLTNFFMSRTTAGNSVVNHNMIQAGINPNLPFGGVNSSGMGRIVGKETFKSFSNMRSIVEQPLGIRDFSTFSFPPYSSFYKKVLKWIAR